MSNWISVEDRLPPIDADVLLTDQRVVFAGRLHQNGMFRCEKCGAMHPKTDFYFASGGRAINHITHWQYYPSVPGSEQIISNANVTIGDTYRPKPPMYGAG